MRLQLVLCVVSIKSTVMLATYTPSNRNRNKITTRGERVNREATTEVSSRRGNIHIQERRQGSTTSRQDMSESLNLGNILENEEDEPLGGGGVGYSVTVDETLKLYSSLGSIGGSMGGGSIGGSQSSLSLSEYSFASPHKLNQPKWNPQQSTRYTYKAPRSRSRISPLSHLSPPTVSNHLHEYNSPSLLSASPDQIPLQTTIPPPTRTRTLPPSKPPPAKPYDASSFLLALVLFTLLHSLPQLTWFPDLLASHSSPTLSSLLLLALSTTASLHPTFRKCIIVFVIIYASIQATSSLFYVLWIVRRVPVVGTVIVGWILGICAVASCAFCFYTCISLVSSITAKVLSHSIERSEIEWRTLKTLKKASISLDRDIMNLNVDAYDGKKNMKYDGKNESSLGQEKSKKTQSQEKIQEREKMRDRTAVIESSLPDFKQFRRRNARQSMNLMNAFK